jgi:hypothetical protein
MTNPTNPKPSQNIELPSFGPFQVIKFKNGYFGVKDLSIKRLQTIASGMNRSQAVDFAAQKRNEVN